MRAPDVCWCAHPHNTPPKKNIYFSWDILSFQRIFPEFLRASSNLDSTQLGQLESRGPIPVLEHRHMTNILIARNPLSWKACSQI